MGRVFIISVLLTIALFAASFSGIAQKAYFVEFTDKNNSPYSLSNPEEYLSERAILRRQKQEIAIDSLDLPVNSGYIKEVLNLGAEYIHSSKWLNAVTVKTGEDNFPVNAEKLPFVKNVQLTKRYSGIKSAVNKFETSTGQEKFYQIDNTLYGESAHQAEQIGAHFLHNQNFKGQGMLIAVLDAGFYKADEYAAFDSLWINGQIKGTKDFVNTDDNLFDGHYHGMSVLSIMGGNIPGELIGTAPKSSYILIRTEDVNTEFLIEEDNWIAGAEYADSAGVDIINSSLGYFLFDDPVMNHTYDDMDGKTTRITRGANIAASKGILVFSSAGNEGREGNPWKYIIAPSDGDSVIAVGAVNRDGLPAPFTSWGPASDGSIKPNVSAVGWNTIIQRNNGTVGTGNGTSYSCPVMAGAAACLWQANPHANASQIKYAIEQSAHLYTNPDSLLGYGIPDIRLADKILKTSFVEKIEHENIWNAYPNPAQNFIILQKNSIVTNKKVEISFYTPEGRLVRKEQQNDAVKIIIENLHTLPSGLLILQIISEDIPETLKISITR